MASGSANAQSNRPAAPAIQQLTIAAWAVNLKLDERTARSTTSGSSTWRNTFGRERKTARWRKLGKRSIDADIVVLTQLKSIKEIRRLFPARTHQLIASRAALANANRRIELVAGNDVEPPLITYDSFPAIAVRRRRGLRVTALRHLAIRSKAGPEASDTLGPQRHIALAVRMRVSGRHLWVMAPITAVRCRKEKAQAAEKPNAAAACPTDDQARQRVQQWLSRTGQSTSGQSQTAVLIAKVVAKQSGAPPAPKNEPHTAGSKSQDTQKPTCKHAERPHIEAAGSLSESRPTLSRQQPAADRPCAAIAILTFED